jgi:hypothetical protein
MVLHPLQTKETFQQQLWYSTDILRIEILNQNKFKKVKNPYLKIDLRI